MIRVERRRTMRIDLYTKVVLTIVALLLAVIAFRPILQPPTVAAQGNFNGVQFGAPGLNFFDTRTGDYWSYDWATGQLLKHWKVTQFGKPLSH
jgi:hypothetical protein